LQWLFGRDKGDKRLSSPMTIMETFRTVSGLPGHAEAGVGDIPFGAGPLGKGVSNAMGVAFGLKHLKKKGTVDVLLADGDSQEGQVLEAMRLASQLQLDNLVVHGDWNDIQLSGIPSKTFATDMPAIAHAMGWAVVEVQNGNDYAQVRAAGDAVDKLLGKGHPIFVCYYTTMGDGVPLMEEGSNTGKKNYHGAPLSEAEAKQALDSLNLPTMAELAEAFEPFRAKHKKTFEAARKLRTSAALEFKTPKGYVRAITDKPGGARKDFGATHIKALMAGDPRILVLHADLADSGGFGAVEKAFPDRVINVGVAEANMYMMAAGMRQAGLLPITYTFAAFGTVGNLLTPNQAQPTTTGAYSLLGLTENTPGAFTVTDSIVAAIAYHPVTVGHTYTLKAKWSSDSPMSVVAQWQDALGVTIRNDYGTSRSGANVASEVTSVAPPGAVQMAAHIVFSVEASVGSAVTIHESSFHRGAGGTFSMPGVPITGQSHIATNGAVHLSGTGTPEGVVTAAPGSTWLQTDSTVDVKGWIRWVKATGTGNTGWVAGPEADTGWRDVTADLLNGWASSSGGRLVIRRVGSRIELTGGYPGITGASKTNDVFYNPPSGFQETATTFGNYALMGHALKQNGGNTVVSGLARESTSGINMVGAATDWTAVTVLAWWTTPDAWPSSLPGSAA
jgi:hypothetical protein